LVGIFYLTCPLYPFENIIHFLLFKNLNYSLVDEWDFGEGKFCRSIKLPPNSGNVSALKCTPNGKQLIW